MLYNLFYIAKNFPKVCLPLSTQYHTICCSDINNWVMVYFYSLLINLETVIPLEENLADLPLNEEMYDGSGYVRGKLSSGNCTSHIL